MKNIRIGISCALLLFLLLAAIPFQASAQTESIVPPSTDDATAVYFYHLNSNTEVITKNTSARLPAGSTVKIMAGLLACEALEDRLNETVTVTSEMVATSAGYRLYIKAGDVLSIRDLLYAALCGSYNDAYDVLAFAVSGSSEAFVELMNQKAASLGATDTHFTEPSGITDGGVTTALDLSKIARYAYQNTLYMSIVSTVKYAFAGSIILAPQTIYNRNALIASNRTTLYYNELCKGINAGYTERGGSCVVTVADNGSDRYLSIVLGAPETDEKNFGYTLTNTLIDWVYSTYVYMEVISPETSVCTLPITVSDLTTEVEIRTKDSLLCYLPKNAEVGKEISYSVRLIYSELEAPVEEGFMVGYVAVLYNGEKIGALPLYTAGTAERSSFIGSLLNLKRLTQNRVFLAGGIFFAISTTGWILAEYLLYRHRHHKWDKYFSSTMTPSPDALKSNSRHSQPNNRKNAKQ